MTFSLETSSDKNLIEQFGKALLSLVREFVQQLASQWAQGCIDSYLEKNNGYRLVHNSRRQIFTPFGKITIPNAEIREGRRYVGTLSQCLFGLGKKKRTLECTREMVASVVSVLSFR